MKVTKWYCDMCGKEIEGTPDLERRCIQIKKISGKHGVHETTIRVFDEDFGGSYMDFCDDCKATIAILFGGKSNE